MNKLEECARAVDGRPWMEEFGGNDATREALRKHSFAVARAVIRCLMEPSALEREVSALRLQLKSGDHSFLSESAQREINETMKFRAMLQSVLDEAGEKE